MPDSELTISASFVSSSRPLSSITFPERSYVLSIAALPSHYAAAASAPSNMIHLVDKSDPRIIVNTLPGHSLGITHIRSARLFQDTREVLLSCGRDSAVKTWDERAGVVGVQMQTADRRTPLLSCDASPDGYLVAAGTVLQGEDASILYWDVRNPAAPLHQHTSTHSDDITAVHFAQHGSTVVLLSASTDGLLCISNPHEGDEDEAIINVANWGCSISKAGWLPRHSDSNRPSIWATSDMETLSFWSDELDLVKEVGRDRLKQRNQVLPWETDYIIDCHIARNGSFHVFSGSNQGDIALISPHEPDDRWSLGQLYTNGHSEIVRCIHWDESAGLLLSGGEDAKLNVWSSPVDLSEPDIANAEQNRPMDVDSPSRKRNFTDNEQNEQKRVRTD